MPEPYAIRWSGGKREVYWSKKDYQAGRIRASNAARKKYKRAMKGKKN